MNSSFECYNSTTSVMKNDYKQIYNCNNEIGFSNIIIIRYFMILISFLGLITNLIILSNYFSKKKKKKNKASMKRLFIYSSFTEITFCIYWIISLIFLNSAGKIYNFYFKHKIICYFMSNIFLFALIFNFSFENILLYHFKNINENPISAILKPNKDIVKFLIFTISTSIIICIFTNYFELFGTSVRNKIYKNIFFIRE